MVIINVILMKRIVIVLDRDCKLHVFAIISICVMLMQLSYIVYWTSLKNCKSLTIE